MGIVPFLQAEVRQQPQVCECRSPGSALGCRGAVLALCRLLGTVVPQPAGPCTPAWARSPPVAPVSLRSPGAVFAGAGLRECSIAQEPPLPGDLCGTGQARFAWGQLGSAALRVLLAPRSV